MPICCKSCPFNSTLYNGYPRCEKPLCDKTDTECYEGCSVPVGGRCKADYYIVDRLYIQDEFAEGAALDCMDSAIARRDRVLIQTLLQASVGDTRLRLVSYLEENEPRLRLPPWLGGKHYAQFKRD